MAHFPSASKPIHTAAEFRNLPYGPPWHQLVDGDLVVMESPGCLHQDVSRNLTFALLGYLEKHPIGRLYYAPFDVYLDDINVFQPDILVVLNERLHILADDGVKGAPDFIVEVLSPSTRRLDLGRKKRVYAQAGVRELWIVDPESQRIDAYRPDLDTAAPVQSWSRNDVTTPFLFPGLLLPTAVAFAR